MIQVDIDPTILGNNFDNLINVAGDVKLVLGELLSRLKQSGKPCAPRPFVDELNRIRRDFWQEAKAELNSEAVPLKPQRVINALKPPTLPSPAVVISDAGTPTPLHHPLPAAEGRRLPFF